VTKYGILLRSEGIGQADVLGGAVSMALKFSGQADDRDFELTDHLGNPFAGQINEVIFPILKCIDEEGWEFIGTGFFIAGNGLFATAKHVLLEAYDYENNKLEHLLLVQWLPNGKYLMRQVLMAAVHPAIDVGVGILYPVKHFITDERLTAAQLCLTAEQPRQGEPIFTYAYPKTIVQNIQRSSVYFYPGYYSGRLEEYYENGRDRILLPYPCYRTSITMHGGASGGPVIDSYGRVFGINSKSYETEDGNPKRVFKNFVTCEGRGVRWTYETPQTVSNRPHRPRMDVD
jgi:Trypsin-like peptidase domain